jgi:HlyD family secretion protein
VFSVDAYPDRSFPAQVKQVRFAPREVNGVVTYETLLAVENADILLRPGMTATAEITVMSLRDVVLIPNAALRFNPPLPDSEGSRQSPGGLLGMFVPAPPTDRKPEVHRESSGESRVWVLKDRIPTPVAVKTGATDGAVTQLIQGDVAPGTPLIIDMVKAES